MYEKITNKLKKGFKAIKNTSSVLKKIARRNTYIAGRRHFSSSSTCVGSTSKFVNNDDIRATKSESNHDSKDLTQTGKSTKILGRNISVKYGISVNIYIFVNSYNKQVVRQNTTGPIF